MAKNDEEKNRDVLISRRDLLKRLLKLSTAAASVLVGPLVLSQTRCSNTPTAPEWTDNNWSDSPWSDNWNNTPWSDTWENWNNTPWSDSPWDNWGDHWSDWYNAPWGNWMESW